MRKNSVCQWFVRRPCSGMTTIYAPGRHINCRNYYYYLSTLPYPLLFAERGFCKGARRYSLAKDHSMDNNVLQAMADLAGGGVIYWPRRYKGLGRSKQLTVYPPPSADANPVTKPGVKGELTVTEGNIGIFRSAKW